jgi:hypothetical protein
MSENIKPPDQNAPLPEPPVDGCLRSKALLQPVQQPCTEQAIHVIQSAAEIAATVRHEFIGTYHILLALLRVQPSVFREVVSRHRIDCSRIGTRSSIVSLPLRYGVKRVSLD